MRFRWKVVIALLLGGLAPAATVLKMDIDRFTAYSREVAEKEIRSSIVLKGMAVENYVSKVVNVAGALADLPETAAAMGELDAAAEELLRDKLIVPDMRKLRERYEAQAAEVPGDDKQEVTRWMTALDPLAVKLQNLYIGTNPNALGKKEDLIDAKDGSTYSVLHARLHPVYRTFAERFGFYDLFLIETQRGRIVYTVEKETDFGTSLRNGPYAKTAFGKAVQSMIDSKGKQPYLFADFENYEPSNGVHAFFMMVPVKKNDELVGILALQLPLDFATEVMKRGEMERRSLDTFLIGPGGELRSTPENTEGLDLEAPLTGPAVDAALRDESGVLVQQNIRGDTVLAAYTPLDLPGLEWAMVSEVSLSEVLAKAEETRQKTIYAALGVAVAVLLLGLIVAQWLLWPIKRLGDEMKAQAAAAIDILRSASVHARSAAETMATTAEQTSRQTQSVMTSAEQMTADVTGAAASVEELSSSIRNVVQGIVQTSELVEGAAERAEFARQMLAELEMVATRITDIVTLINDVANQTNLLSLNAAIEASHAGVAGRGFAVVAAEIRKLAARTTDSTEEIATEVRQVLTAVGRNADAIRGISERIDQVNGQARDISVAAGQQGEVTRDIAGRMAMTAGRVTAASTSLVQVHSASTEAAKAANDVLGGMQQVEQATAAMDAAMTSFVRRVRAL